jgi:hypothetical protein
MHYDVVICHVEGVLQYVEGSNVLLRTGDIL